MVGGETWSLVGKRSSLATIISRAPSSTFAEASATAFPRLRALLGTFPVVGLGDGAVLVVGVGGAVSGPVVFPEGCGVVVVLAGGGDVSMAETNTWGSASRDCGGEESSDSGEFHFKNYNYII